MIHPCRREARLDRSLRLFALSIPNVFDRKTSQFVLLQAGPDIDFMSVHMYPDSWLACSDECKLDWAQRWVRTLRIWHDVRQGGSSQQDAHDV